MSLSHRWLSGLCWLLLSSSSLLAQDTGGVQPKPSVSVAPETGQRLPTDGSQPPTAEAAEPESSEQQQSDGSEQPPREAGTSEPERADQWRPAPGAMSLGSESGFGIGTAIGDPTALFGPDRTEAVLNATTRASSVSVSGFYAIKPTDNQRLLFEVNFDPTFVGLDASYGIRPHGGEGLVTFNGWLSSARFAPFEEAMTGVLLPNRKEPYLQQGGMGLEYSTPLSSNFDLAAAVNYQNYAFSDSLFGGDRYPVDLTDQNFQIVRRSPGEIYSLNLHGIYSSLDDHNLPARGAKVRLAAEQGVALGNSSSSYSRLATNITGLVPMPGFNDGEHTLLLNLQAGTILGTAPSVRSFHLGGPFSVRGYAPGEMASGTSFVGATAEYRHHLTNLSIMNTEVGLRGTVFVDYGTVLGTQRQVRGIPQYLFDKPSDGTGYGVGLQFATDYGLFKLETAWTNQGDNAVYFSVGERF